MDRSQLHTELTLFILRLEASEAEDGQTKHAIAVLNFLNAAVAAGRVDLLDGVVAEAIPQIFGEAVAEAARLAAEQAGESDA